MGIRETLGLTRSKARPVGKQLERGWSEEPSVRRNLLMKGGIFTGLLLITLLAFPRGELYHYTVQVGEQWRQQTLVAPFTFAVYKAGETLARERRTARQSTPPYFRPVRDAQAQVTANRDTLAGQLERIFAAYGAYRQHRTQGERVEAREDSLRYLELRRSARGLTLTPEQWHLLTRSYLRHQPSLRPENVPPADEPRLDQQLLRTAWELSVQFLNVGVLNIPRDSVHTEEIIIRNEQERVDRAKPVANVYGLEEAYRTARSQFTEQFAQEPRRADLAMAFFRAIFEKSLRYMRAVTLQQQEERVRSISPTRGVVQRGEIVVSQGEHITSDIKRRLVSLERAVGNRGGRTILWKQVLGQFLLSLVTYLIFFLYLFFLRRRVFQTNRTVLLIALLFAGIIGAFALVVRIPTLSLYLVPVAIASVQLTILFDSRVGLFGTLTLALIGGLMSGMDLEYTLATFFAGTLGVFSVRDIKNRGQYFLSGGLVFLGYLVVFGAVWLLFGMPSERLFTDFGYVAANSLFVVLAYPLLWLFERGFDITTDLTLLELSDTNRPLLKELSLRAPGSFNHSLQVANLAEAAADAVGANALLARVGALYHDIGKMLKPEYFVENQRSGENPHDRLKPRLSALIIASHVKEGLEMGRQHGLPQRVLNFIPMHHGTTRIEYFYQKALEGHEMDESTVLESEFRYPGPCPSARETGILMLADGVEAASRSLEEPTHKRLQNLIDAIFRARIDDGQLDETNLTFRDLNRIKETFLSMLTGIYHIRVKYPDQEEGADAPEDQAPGAPSGTEFDDDRALLGPPEQGIPAHWMGSEENRRTSADGDTSQKQQDASTNTSANGADEPGAERRSQEQDKRD